jgi:hypothetical protein
MTRSGATMGRGRRSKVVVVALAVIAALVMTLMTGCGSQSGDSGDGTDSTVTANEQQVKEGVPQPPGHVGLWFGEEPQSWDRLNHLVWASQRYVGDPVELPKVGDRAMGPEARDLPDVCDQQVMDRLEALGLRPLSPSDVGYKYTQCSAIGRPEEESLDGISIYWGSLSDVGMISDQEPDGLSVRNGTETLDTGEIADVFGCVGLRRPFSKEGAVFSYFGRLSTYGTCSQAEMIIQMVFNTFGGSLVQV